MAANDLRNITLPLLDVGFVRIQRSADGGDYGAVAVDGYAREYRVVADKVAGEIRIEAKAGTGNRGRIAVHAVGLLMRPSILQLEDDAGTEGAHEACTEVLTG